MDMILIMKISLSRMVILKRKNYMCIPRIHVVTLIMNSNLLFPISTDTTHTTLRELYYGKSCWFTMEFTEWYRVDHTSGHWLEFETRNDIIVFIDDCLLYGSMK